jgi:glycosyltransferase involved in cell wall biosynthesis
VTAPRLNWFGPLPPQRTDIAHYTARIAKALMDRFEVVFWSDLAADARALPRGARVRQFDPARIGERDLNGELFTGLNIYNFGNDARFHTGVAIAARKIAGLAILHDTRLHHFAFGRSAHEEPRFASYVALAREIYGAAGEAKARGIVETGGRAIDEHVDEMPFVEAFADRSLGVICHSEAASRDLRARSDTPILTLPLPFTSLAHTPSSKRVWAPPWRLAMFGYIHTNRRLESVLSALGDWPAAPDFHLDIYGALWDPSLIDRLIVRAGLGSRVTVHGFVPEQALDEAIAAAHLTFNLRHPTMGEASGGILRSWAHATPALVTDAGWYADLPAAVARKVSIENEIPDIRQALGDLARDPGAYERMGLAARERLREAHSPEIYADKLAAALDDLPRLMTRFASRRMLLDLARASRSIEERAMLLERATPRVASLFN